MCYPSGKCLYGINYLLIRLIIRNLTDAKMNRDIVRDIKTLYLMKNRVNNNIVQYLDEEKRYQKHKEYFLRKSNESCAHRST